MAIWHWELPNPLNEQNLKIVFVCAVPISESRVKAQHVIMRGDDTDFGISVTLKVTLK